MTTATADLVLAGTHGKLVVRRWLPTTPPRSVALIAHGYAEHSGRYTHLAAQLTNLGAAVYAPDHLGHGRSEGARAHMGFVEDMATDLQKVAVAARFEHGRLPQVLIGHSMGGIVATRFAQRFGSELAALVLSGPVIGGNPDLMALAQLDPFPAIEIDPALLSRDPAVGAGYLADPLVYHGPLQSDSLAAWESLVTAVATGGSLGELPTLWVHGSDDQLAPLASTSAAVETIRGSKLTARIYPEARHEVFNEINRDEVLTDVCAFIRCALDAHQSRRRSVPRPTRHLRPL